MHGTFAKKISQTITTKYYYCVFLERVSKDCNYLQSKGLGYSEKEKQDRVSAKYRKLLTSRDFVAIYEFKIVPLCTLQTLLFFRITEPATIPNNTRHYSRLASPS